MRQLVLITIETYHYYHCAQTNKWALPQLASARYCGGQSHQYGTMGDLTLKGCSVTTRPNVLQAG